MLPSHVWSRELIRNVDTRTKERNRFNSGRIKNCFLGFISVNDIPCWIKKTSYTYCRLIGMAKQKIEFCFLLTALSFMVNWSSVGRAKALDNGKRKNLIFLSIFLKGDILILWTLHFSLINSNWIPNILVYLFSYLGVSRVSVEGQVTSII